MAIATELTLRYCYPRMIVGYFAGPLAVSHLLSSTFSGWGIQARASNTSIPRCRISAKSSEVARSLTERFPSRQLRVPQLCPASMMVEVSHQSRCVHLATFPCWFTTLHTFQHTQQTLMLLGMSCDAARKTQIYW